MSPQPQHTSQPSKSNYDAFASLSTSRPTSQSTTPVPSLVQQKQAAPPPHSDPFAALVSPSPRTSSPLQNQQRAPQPTAQSSSLLDLGEKPSPPNPHSQPTNNGAPADDDWTFTSSLPEQTFPNENHVDIHKSFIKIAFHAARSPGQPSIHIVANFSNEVTRTISGLHFQVAVEKVLLHVLLLRLQ